jgi:ABC-type antimicrobial peptide transport system permease subunit
MSLTSMTPDGAAAEYPIVGIFEPPTLFMGGAGEAPAGGFELPPDYVGMFWRDLTALDGAEVTSKLRPQMYFVTTPDDEASADDVDDLGDTINDELLGHGIPIFSFNFVQLTDEISQGFFRIQAILSAVAGLIALVGALGLLTTLSMSVFERQKEIGVMRSIGAGSSTVAIQFLTEGMVVGVIAWLVGLPFMLLLQLLLLQIIGPEIFSLEISPAAILVGLIGMIIITTIASLWPSLGAARKTVSDILRYQ